MGKAGNASGISRIDSAGWAARFRLVKPCKYYEIGRFLDSPWVSRVSSVPTGQYT